MELAILKKTTAANVALVLLAIGVVLYAVAMGTAITPGHGIARHAVRRANIVPGLVYGLSSLVLILSLWLAGYGFQEAKRRSIAVLALVLLPSIAIIVTSLVQSASRGEL